MSINNKELRSAFGLFATGVSIATTSDHKQSFCAMTINSLSSVSLKPPLLLFCIDNSSKNLEAFSSNEHFALSILSEDQIELSRQFAVSKNNNKWSLESHSLAKYGSPFFDNSLVYFECKRQQVIAAGDHQIIIGEVVDCQRLKDKNPLLYFKSSYKD